MSKFIVFTVPDIAFEGIDYLYHLIELKDNDLGFAIVTAQNMADARRKYFDNYIYPHYDKDFSIHKIACDQLRIIYESFDEADLIKMFGETDGSIIWQMSPEDGIVTEKIASATFDVLSDKTLQELCFIALEMDIAVSEVAMDIK